VLELDGREVKFSNPGKVFFPERGHTKLDLREYYLAVAEPFLAHMLDPPTSMKRFPNGASGDFFFQKRVPKTAPDWVEQMTVPRGWSSSPGSGTCRSPGACRGCTGRCCSPVTKLPSHGS
jgi:DNA primase